MDEEENPEINGHHFKISRVVLSSKHKSRKFVSFEDIPSFLYNPANEFAFIRSFYMLCTSPYLSFPNIFKIRIPKLMMSNLDPSSSPSYSRLCITL